MAEASSTTARPSTAVFRFLDLPRELRDMVYDLLSDVLCLPSNFPIVNYHITTDGVGLLQARSEHRFTHIIYATCRQVKEEASSQIHFREKLMDHSLGTHYLMYNELVYTVQAAPAHELPGRTYTVYGCMVASENFKLWLRFIEDLDILNGPKPHGVTLEHRASRIFIERTYEWCKRLQEVCKPLTLYEGFPDHFEGFSERLIGPDEDLVQNIRKEAAEMDEKTRDALWGGNFGYDIERLGKMYYEEGSKRHYIKRGYIFA